jgi:hypothetical protein
MPTTLAIEIAHAARDRKDTETMFWSEKGEVACAMHAPYPGTDTWNWERWSPMTTDEQKAFTREVGRAPHCEVCNS